MDFFQGLVDNIKGAARSAVSGDKMRFQNGGFDLDLCYITPRIIAMAVPATSVDTLWRNNIDDVARFMETYHAGHYLIFNLTENSYDYSKFKGMVKHFGWLDHNAPPTWLLVECVAAMSDWLAQHPQNVCAIHCLAGKGRTGTVICSYLLHDKQAETPEQALQFFSRQRYSKISPNKPVGVEVPSQVRAVHYYGKLLSGSMPVDALSAPRKLLLKRVIMYPVPLLGVMKEGCQPLIEVYQNGQQPGAKPLYTTPVTTFKFTANDVCITMDFNIVIEGDIQLRLYNLSKILGRTIMFRCFFHTSFLDDQCFLDFGPKQLDADNIGNILNMGGYSTDFKLRLLFGDA